MGTRGVESKDIYILFFMCKGFTIVGLLVFSRGGG